MPNQSQSTPVATTPAPVRLKLLRVAVVVLLVLFVGEGLVLILRPSRPVIIVTPLPDGWPNRKRSLSDRVMAVMPISFWRLKQAVFGPAKRILLKSAIMDCQGFSNALPSALSLGGPQFADTNGLQVWLLGDSELEQLRHRLEQMPANALISSPRFDDADGVEGQMFVGETIPIDGVQRQVGIVMNLLPRLGQKSTDLSAVITVSETLTNRIAASAEHQPTDQLSIRTNLAVAARIQIPAGHGAFLLDGANPVARGKRIGVFISATAPAASPPSSIRQKPPITSNAGQ